MALRTQVPPLFKLQRYCSVCRDSHVNLLIYKQGACKLWEHLGTLNRRQAYVATWKGQRKTFLLTEDAPLPDKLGFERGNTGDKQKTETQERNSESEMQVKEGGKRTHLVSGCSFIVVNIL